LTACEAWAGAAADPEHEQPAAALAYGGQTTCDRVDPVAVDGLRQRCDRLEVALGVLRSPRVRRLYSSVPALGSLSRRFCEAKKPRQVSLCTPWETLLAMWSRNAPCGGG